VRPEHKLRVRVRRTHPTYQNNLDDVLVQDGGNIQTIEKSYFFEKSEIDAFMMAWIRSQCLSNFSPNALEG